MYQNKIVTVVQKRELLEYLSFL